MKPKVTVLMAVYNGEKYLCEAVDSMLGQTFPDFEFIIIDDGSTDRTGKILRSYNDNRIRLVKNEANLGLTKSLNLGLQLAQGEYIARMDSDEISLPERLEEQVRFLDNNEEIGCCGTLVKIFGAHEGVWCFPLDHDHIKSTLLFHSCLVHASVMLRKSVLIDHAIQYNEGYICAQDYDLWVRLSRVTRLANIGNVLLLHRLHNSSVGVMSASLQNETASKIRLQQLDNLGVSYSKEEAEWHHFLGRSLSKQLTHSLGAVNRWLIRLKKSNERKGLFPEPAFSETLGLQLMNVVRLNGGSSCCRFQILFGSQLSPFLGLSLRQRAVVWIKKNS